MILRAAATLTLLAGLGAFAAYLHVVGKFPTAGLAARHLREMKDRVAVPSAANATTYGAMESMPKRLPVADYSAMERQAVTLEGYIQHQLRAADDDIHLELTPVRRLPSDGNIRYVTAEITPEWRRGSSRWSYARLVEAFHPTVGGVTPWDGGTRRVRLTGWLLYDKENEGAPVLGRPRLTSWELHPVTRIELWSDSLNTFVEYPR